MLESRADAFSKLWRSRQLVTPRSVFLTGAGGFVGRSVVARLRGAAVPVLRMLVRRSESGPTGSLPPGWRLVIGDLAQPGGWADQLNGIETVIHLAAKTGKAARGELWAANVGATRHLVDAARRAGVRRFLFVSTVAAGYTDRRHYHYANAKAAAEAVVLESGLDALVVRPTPVFGPGSPVLANLERLATLGVPIMFGGGVPMQPIHVEDLAAGVVAALDLKLWGGRIVDLGGPVVIHTGDLIAAIRARRGLPSRRPIQLPLEPLRTLLALAEPLLLPILPFSAGQLAAFANPAVATRAPGPLGLPEPELGIDSMLS